MSIKGPVNVGKNQPDSVGSKPDKNSSDYNAFGLANSDLNWKVVIGVKIKDEPTDLFPIDNEKLR
jgi:hypothetical protein